MDRIAANERPLEPLQERPRQDHQPFITRRRTGVDGGAEPPPRARKQLPRRHPCKQPAVERVALSDVEQSLRPQIQADKRERTIDAAHGCFTGDGPRRFVQIGPFGDEDVRLQCLTSDLRGQTVGLAPRHGLRRIQIRVRARARVTLCEFDRVANDPRLGPAIGSAGNDPPDPVALVGDNRPTGEDPPDALRDRRGARRGAGIGIPVDNKGLEAKELGE